MFYAVVNGKVVELRKGLDGLYRDSQGVIFALPSDELSRDAAVRCGVGILSLPEDTPLTAACRPHDYAYTSPAYQMFHSREEADEYLRSLVEQTPGYAWLAKPFYWIVRALGGLFWDNKETR